MLRRIFALALLTLAVTVAVPLVRHLTAWSPPSQAAGRRYAFGDLLDLLHLERHSSVSGSKPNCPCQALKPPVLANPPVNEGLNKMWAFAHRCGSPNGELQQLPQF